MAIKILWNIAISIYEFKPSGNLHYSSLKKGKCGVCKDDYEIYTSKFG
ncbi:hypothetical protein ABOONEI_103 [Aciduliprofundum boonei T469]|nr:hypothetical protein ABOONEI_103 [Aciduliprofundum boonei T469]